MKLEGKSLRPLVVDPTAKHKEVAITVVKRGAVLGRSIRTDTFRYTEWNDGNRGRSCTTTRPTLASG